MLALKVVPKIYYYDTFREFSENFNIGAEDLIITNRWIYEPYLRPLQLDAGVIYQEQYGNGEPTDLMIEALLKDAGQFTYKRVIAIGGGTIIDISKILSLKKADKIFRLFTGEDPVIQEKELIIVPTTCGTGSEVTNVSVVSLTGLHTKKGLASDATYAKAAVLIPESLQGLPDGVFATSSIDALIHAAESYLSPKASPYTEIFSVKAIEMIVSAYCKIVSGGNTRQSREPFLKDFCLAANYAGIAFGNAGCGPVHAMSYALGSEFHLPHGEANYLLFTAVLEKYKEKCPEGAKLRALTELLSRLLGCAESDVLISLDNLLNHLIQKKSLSECGMTESQIMEFTEMTIMNQQRLLANAYVELTEEDITSAYKNVF